MTDKPLFLSTQENLSDFLPMHVELMNGYVHRLFLSAIPDGLSLLFSQPIEYSLSGNELTIDLRNRDGLGSFSLFIRAQGYPEQSYQFRLMEKVSFEDLCGTFTSSEKKNDVLSFSSNGKIFFSFSHLLFHQELFFSFLSFSPLTGKVLLSPTLIEEKKYFLELNYDIRKDAFFLILIREEYSDDDSYSRVLIGKNGPVPFYRKRE